MRPEHTLYARLTCITEIDSISNVKIYTIENAQSFMDDDHHTIEPSRRSFIIRYKKRCYFIGFEKRSISALSTINYFLDILLSVLEVYKHSGIGTIVTIL